MNPIRALIVDDEPLARRGLRQLLAQESDVEILEECGDGQSAILAVQDHQPDLVFLDIEMPEMDGFGVIDALGVLHMPAVVFVTAYNAYAVRAFDVQAVDYLLKPTDQAHLKRALDRVRNRLQLRVSAAAPDGTTDETVARQLESLLQAFGRTQPARYAKRIVVRQQGKMQFVDLQMVSRIETDGNYLELHAEARCHLLREPMRSLEQRLDPVQFLRVSRSAIVRIDGIAEVQALFNGDFAVVMKDGAVVQGSRNYRSRLETLAF